MLTQNILSLIGNTPLLQLPGESIFVKAEFPNPGGSIKDRVALAMLEAAERDGKLHEDSIIVEPTSGNTGIGLALVGRIKGYKVRIVMPEGMSEERKKLVKALGADLVLTPDKESIPGAVRCVEEMAREDPNVFVPQQFENPENPKAHYFFTAVELWRQMEPKNVSALLGHEPGLHQIQGIGDGFVPAILDVKMIDEVIEVTDEDAIEETRRLGRENGLLVGISSGANVWAARRLAERTEGNIATVLPDRAERYFSTALL